MNLRKWVVRIAFGHPSTMEAAEQLASVLMAGAFEEGRLRGALEQANEDLYPYDGQAAWRCEYALCAPALEEGER